MEEVWKTIPDWDLYEVSNFGRLRGKDRIIRDGKGAYLRRARLLKLQTDKHGYHTFSLKQDGKRKEMKIHRAVAMAFIPNPENKPCVNHIDNNPSNNHVDNLEWCTMQENTDWMIKQGRFARNKQWIERLKHSVQKQYKPVVATNIVTGEKLHFKNLLAVKEAGFQPSCVSNCCNHKRGRTNHKGYRWEFEEQKNESL